MASIGQATVDVVGDRELEAALKRFPKELRREISKELRAIGAMVRDEIRSRTPVHGASRDARRRMRAGYEFTHGGTTYSTGHRPGTLKRSTVSRARFLRVTITNTAKRVSRKYPGGYRYGKRIEFDPKIRRAFFYPGFEAKRPEVERRFDAVLDRVARRYWTDRATGGA